MDDRGPAVMLFVAWGQKRGWMSKEWKFCWMSYRLTRYWMERAVDWHVVWENIDLLIERISNFGHRAHSMACVLSHTHISLH